MAQRRWREVPLLTLFVALPALSGCSGDGESSGIAATESRPHEETFSGGPVSLVVRLDRRELDLADQLRLEQELRVEEGFEAEFPEFLPEDFEGFAVVDVEGPDRIGGDANGDPESGGAGGTLKVLRKRFLLEPDRSGELAIAPMEVYFHAEGEAKESSFPTGEIKVTVKALEDLGDLQVRPPYDILESAPQEKNMGLIHLALGGIFAAAVVAFTLWFFFFRSRAEKAPPPVPPHQIAWESLRRLVMLDLVAKGEVERFYVHLSAIMRHYIEGRFGVHAEELTTEEFFEAATKAPEIAPYRNRLKEFLDLCDQVKFARFEPEKMVIQSSFDVLKKFIEETTPHGS